MFSMYYMQALATKKVELECELITRPGDAAVGTQLEYVNEQIETARTNIPGEQAAFVDAIQKQMMENITAMMEELDEKFGS